MTSPILGDLFDSLALGLLAGYHGLLWLALRRRPLTTAIGRNRAQREAWVERVMEREADLLAVQSLRNWTMTATFLASTAILVGLGILQFVFAAEQQLAHTLLTSGAAPIARGVGTLKLLLLASLFLGAFFAFTQTLRLLNHQVFALGAPASAARAAVVADLATAANWFTLGMRGFYLALPVALWLFGAGWFLAATIILLVLLVRLDYPRPPTAAPGAAA